MPRLLACMGALALVASGCGLTIDYVPEDGSPGQDAATALDGGVLPALTELDLDGVPASIGAKDAVQEALERAIARRG